MTQQQQINAMMLAHAMRYTPAALNAISEQAGSIDDIMDHRRDIRALLPQATDRLVGIMQRIDEHRSRAEEEYDFCQKHGIQILVRSGSEGYPARLRQCDDAPFVLYYRGHTPLDAPHTLSIVGTRHATAYGKDFLQHLVADLGKRLPGLIIVSGLAYGIDICAHREALQHSIDTVAVLAHGLDTIYPAAHRNDAARIAGQGGLLTEYMSRTKADKMQFVQRNRIVAGITDGTLVVESAGKGGALITARIAREYNREVMAVPGSVGNEYSKGCNNIIRENVATLVTSADDIVEAMGWQSLGGLSEAGKPTQRQLFPQLGEREQRIVDLLGKENDLNVNILAARTGIDVGQLFALLFNLEMQGVVRAYAGGTYHLVE